MYKNPHPAHTMLADVIFKERWDLLDKARYHLPWDYLGTWDAVHKLTKKYTRREMLATARKLELTNTLTLPIKDIGEIVTHYVVDNKDIPDWMVDPASRLPVSSIDYGED